MNELYINYYHHFLSEDEKEEKKSAIGVGKHDGISLYSSGTV